MSPQAQAAAFVDDLNRVILFPTILLLMGVAFLVFVWGCAEYLMNADSDQAREDGKKHILYGVIGLVIMTSAYALLAIGTGTFGLSRQLNCADNPSASGCANAFDI